MSERGVCPNCHQWVVLPLGHVGANGYTCTPPRYQNGPMDCLDTILLRIETLLKHIVYLIEDEDEPTGHGWQPADVCPHCGIMAGCDVIKEHIAVNHPEEGQENGNL